MSAQLKTINPLHRIKEYADLEVQSRSRPIGPMIAALFFAILTMTPVYRRLPDETHIFAGAIFSASLILSVFSIYFITSRIKPGSILRTLFSGCIYATAVLFGLFVAYINL